MRAELRSRAVRHVPGALVAVAEVPATPEPPEVLLYGERYYRRTAVEGFNREPRAIYTEGTLLTLTSEAVARADGEKEGGGDS